jgi:hypothetical protein
MADIGSLHDVAIAVLPEPDSRQKAQSPKHVGMSAATHSHENVAIAHPEILRGERPDQAMANGHTSFITKALTNLLQS